MDHLLEFLNLVVVDVYLCRKVLIVQTDALEKFQGLGQLSVAADVNFDVLKEVLVKSYHLTKATC
jgi:hypothetical protein